MDLKEAMNLWTTECDGTLSGWDTKEGYYTLFIKTGMVRGHAKATAGGIRWEWPDELMEAHKEQEEWKKYKKSRIEAVEEAMVKSSLYQRNVVKEKLENQLCEDEELDNLRIDVRLDDLRDAEYERTKDRIEAGLEKVGLGEIGPDGREMGN